MESVLMHVYAFAEIYSVLLCWLVVPLIFAASYFYFARNLCLPHASLSEHAPTVTSTPTLVPSNITEISTETISQAVTEQGAQLLDAASESEMPPTTENPVTEGGNAEPVDEQQKVANG